MNDAVSRLHECITILADGTIVFDYMTDVTRKLRADDIRAVLDRLEAAERALSMHGQADDGALHYMVAQAARVTHFERFGGRDETKTVEFEAYVFPVHGGKSGRELRAGNINDADELKVFADEKVRIRVWRRE